MAARPWPVFLMHSPADDRISRRMIRFPAIRRLGATVLAAFCAFLASTGMAHAYLDPVSGTAIVHGLLAAAAGGLLAVKLYFRRIRDWFRARFGEPPATEDQDPADRQS